MYSTINRDNLNIYYLENIACDQPEYPLSILKVNTTPTRVFINYGDHMDEYILNQGTEIRWSNNVIIKMDGLDHYKSAVTCKKLVIMTEVNLLEQLPYIPPQNVTLAAGSVWET